MTAEKFRALLQCLRVTDNGLYGIGCGARDGEQAVFHRKFNDPVDVETAGEDQIHDGSDLARVAVFQWEDGAIIGAVLDRTVNRGKVATGEGGDF